MKIFTAEERYFFSFFKSHKIALSHTFSPPFARQAPYFSSLCPVLRSASLELEDCFGRGLARFLSRAGPRLRRLSLSCNSDPDSTLLPEDSGGGQVKKQISILGYLQQSECKKTRRIV